MVPARANHTCSCLASPPLLDCLVVGNSLLEPGPTDAPSVVQGRFIVRLHQREVNSPFARLKPAEVKRSETGSSVAR